MTTALLPADDAHVETEEQSAVYAAATSTADNLMLQAYAGCGKTTTLEGIERAVPRQPILYLVFSKANAKAAARRMLSTTTVKTINAIGHNIWSAQGARNLRLDAQKSGVLLREIINAAPRAEQSAMWNAFSAVTDGVALAKALGYVPSSWTASSPLRLISRSAFHARLDERPDELTAELIDVVLMRSIREAFRGFIDFNDQVYMPALWGSHFLPRFPLILVDEYQDLSPVDHALIARLTGLAKGTPHARLIGVGDEYQSIYAFRGARAGGMAEAIQQYSMTTFPLSISFRCPSEIVNHVHWRVPQFRASRHGGAVHTPATLSVNDIPESSTIICRNNAPLLHTAFNLLAHGHGVNVAGTDIGPRLIKTMQKLGDESMPQYETLAAIDAWAEERLAADSKTARDKAECMRVFARHGDSLGQAIAYAQHLLAQSGSITLLTGHKAKGHEWPNVIHLDPQLVRINPASQDPNIDYVISTRSSDNLTEIAGDNIRWS